MKRMLIVLVACLVLGGGIYAMADETATSSPATPSEIHKGGDGNKGGRQWKPLYEQPIIERIVSNPKLVERMGLTEAQLKTLKDFAEGAKAQQEKTKTELKAIGMEQARLMTASNIDEQAVMALVDKAGALRIEAAKTGVRQLIVLKNTLTPEQLEMLKKMRQHHMQQMRKEREGGEQGGEMKRPPKDHEGDGEEGEGKEPQDSPAPAATNEVPATPAQ